MAVLADALINLLEKRIVSLIQLLQHLLAVVFLSSAKLVVLSWHMESCFENTQIR